MPELLKTVGSMDKKCDLNISLTKKFLFCSIICKIVIHTLYFKGLYNIASR